MCSKYSMQYKKMIFEIKKNDLNDSLIFFSCMLAQYNRFTDIRPKFCDLLSKMSSIY